MEAELLPRLLEHVLTLQHMTIFDITTQGVVPEVYWGRVVAPWEKGLLGNSWLEPQDAVEVIWSQMALTAVRNPERTTGVTDENPQQLLLTQALPHKGHQLGGAAAEP